MIEENTNRNTLSEEQILQIKEDILLKPKVDWSEDELELFYEWFYNYGLFYRGFLHLLKGHNFKIEENSLYIYALNEDDAIDIVQSWTVKFLANKKFAPENEKSFLFYFLRGIDLLAINRQRLSSTRKTSFIEDVFSFSKNEDEMETEVNIRDEKSLNPEEELLEKEKRIIFKNLINRLEKKPPEPKYARYAKALTLFLEGKKYEEIAVLLGITLTNTKVVIKRAKTYITKDYAALEKAGKLYIFKQTDYFTGGMDK